jgi:uncharacterized spore protein YtfJ
MTTTYENAEEAARQAATGGPVDRTVERLAELVGAKANVRAVFGEPIQKGELTVVPVARVRWGVGGGSGKSDAKTDGPASGSGGGGGAVADPVGYLEIVRGEATFRPIRAPYPNPALVLAAALGAAIVIRAISRLAGR